MIKTGKLKFVDNIAIIPEDWYSIVDIEGISRGWWVMQEGRVYLRSIEIEEERPIIEKPFEVSCEYIPLFLWDMLKAIAIRTGIPITELKEHHGMEAIIYAHPIYFHPSPITREDQLSHEIWLIRATSYVNKQRASHIADKVRIRMEADNEIAVKQKELQHIRDERLKMWFKWESYKQANS